LWAEPPDGWHQVTLHVVVSGTASSVDVSLDGTPVTDLSLTGQNIGHQSDDQPPTG
jgi:hypothetical protein